MHENYISTKELWQIEHYKQRLPKRDIITFQRHNNLYINISSRSMECIRIINQWIPTNAPFYMIQL